MVLVGEHAAESSQPCRKGAINDRITVLEEAYEGYQLLQVQPFTNESKRKENIALDELEKGLNKIRR